MNSSELNPFTNAKSKNRPLILDGAMGSLLQQKGFKSSGTSWMTKVNSESPETIISIHRDYINSGANIITTNTFRTNPTALGDIDISKNEVEKAVSLAKSVVGDETVLIAGSNAPAEDCYQKERTISYKILKENHINHIDFLRDNDVDFILNETQSHLDEIEIICKHCSINSIPFVVSLYLNDNLKLLSGEDFEVVIKFIQKHNPLAIGINCIPPAPLSKIVKILDESINFGFYINCIKGSQKKSKIECSISPTDYGKIVKENIKFSWSFIGACCGSSPEHINEIKKVLDG